jgi:hypothetical protein
MAGLSGGYAPANLCGAVSPVAVFILAICFAGALLAGAAFAWAALRGEFSDAEQTAFLVFDDEDAAAEPRSRPARVIPRAHPERIP